MILVALIWWFLAIAGVVLVGITMLAVMLLFVVVIRTMLDE